MSQTPPRFSEPAFRRYEYIITETILTYPNPVTINCKLLGLSPETVSARLRDAATGYRNYNYTAYGFSREDFNRVWPAVEVVNLGDTVVVRPRGSGRQPVSLTAEAIETDQSAEWTLAEVEAVMLLLSRRKITSRVQVNGWTVEKLQSQVDTNQYDCAVIQEDNKIYLL